MAAAGEIFRSNFTELLDESPSSADELHVLAVDDNLVDRKVIERLLKISSCKGNNKHHIEFNSICLRILFGLVFELILKVCLELDFIFFCFSDGCGEWKTSSSIFGVRWREQ